jgi:hypothetical protein
MKASGAGKPEMINKASVEKIALNSFLRLNINFPFARKNPSSARLRSPGRMTAGNLTLSQFFQNPNKAGFRFNQKRFQNNRERRAFLYLAY